MSADAAARPSGRLAGRVVAVTGAASPLADGLADGLADAGADVVRVPDVGSRAAVEAGFAPVPRLDGLVHAQVDPLAVRRRPLAEWTGEQWADGCEGQLRAALHVLQAAHPRMRDGGRIVVTCPTVGLTGAPGLVPLSTAAEGLRLLAKAAARRWGPRGITVNTVSYDVAVTAPELADVGVNLRQPPLPPTDVRADLAPLVALLLDDDAHHLTGSSLLADAGVVMVP